MIKYKTYEFKTTKEEIERRKHRALRFNNIFSKHDERNEGINLENVSINYVMSLIYSDLP